MKSNLTAMVVALGLIMGAPGMQAAPRGPQSFGGQGMVPSPRISKAMEKLFGENSAYSATMEMQQKDVKMPGKIYFDQGKIRFEMDMSQARNPAMGADVATQMKAMGMDRMTAISRPDKKISYIIYPGLEAYAEMPLQEAPADAKQSSDDLKVNVTELGKDTVDGHPTTKNKVVVTDGKATHYEATVWNATDLKNFPLKIQNTQEGQEATMLFKDVKLGKPEVSLFEPPANFKKYANMNEMMQQEIMKRMGVPGGMGMPGGMPPSSRPGK